MQSVWASFVVRSVPCRQCGQRNQMGCRPQEFRGGDSSHNNRTRAQAGWQCHTHSVNYQVGTRLGAPGRRHQPRGAKQEEPAAQEVAPTLERPLPGLQGPGRPPSPGMPPPPAEVSLQRRPLCAGGWGAERKSTDAQGRCPEPGPGPWGLRSGSRVGAEPRRGGGAGRGGWQSRFPGNPGSPARLPTTSNRRSPGPREAPRRPGWGLTHLGQTAPVLGVLPAQHLLQFVHPEPVRAAAARPPPPVALLRPRPFRVRAPPRCAPRPGACPPGSRSRRRLAGAASRLRTARFHRLVWPRALGPKGEVGLEGRRAC